MDPCLAIGNGRLGVLVFGGVNQERLQLNEDTLWGSGPYDPVNPGALGALPEGRRLIFEGKDREAAGRPRDWTANFAATRMDSTTAELR